MSEGETQACRAEYTISELTEIYLKWKYTKAVNWKLNSELSESEKLKLIEILNSHILMLERSNG